MEILPDNSVRLEDVQKSQALIKALYDDFLKDDPEFHFFFEPELIIRVGSENCLEKIKNYLSQEGIRFDEYEYPFQPNGKYGEGKDGIVANNLDMFIKIFHANAVSALTMNEMEFFDYIERVIHTAFNPRFYSHNQEGMALLNLARLKLGDEKLRDVILNETNTCA